MTMAILWAAIAWAGPVKLTTSDGAILAAEDWGTGARGVLLVHDEGRTRADWAAYAPKLAENGCRVLALDLRGHGASTIATALPETDWTAMTQDLAAGVAWLKTKGATEVHVVGAKLGANLALQYASATPDITDIVLLSPSLNARGVKLSASAAAYGARPLLIAVAADDPTALKAATWLDAQATGPKRLATWPAAGSGAQMLNKVPELETLIVGWVNGSFLSNPDATDLGKDLKSGDVGAVETTGTRLEDRER